MAKKLIEVILTCSRCKKEKHLEFDCENYNRLREYFYPEDLHPERYCLWHSDILPKGNKLTIFCPTCYPIVEIFSEGLRDDRGEKLQRFVRGEE